MHGTVRIIQGHKIAVPGQMVDGLDVHVDTKQQLERDVAVLTTFVCSFVCFVCLFVCLLVLVVC